MSAEIQTFGEKAAIKENVEMCTAYVIASKLAANISTEKLYECKVVCCREIDVATNDVEIKNALEKFVKAFVALV